jgi:hypothetical protein
MPVIRSLHSPSSSTCSLPEHTIARLSFPCTFSKSVTQPLQEASIGRNPGALRPGSPGIVPTGRDLEHAAHEPHRIGAGMLLDETEPHWGISAKMPIAFLTHRAPCACDRAHAADGQSPPPDQPERPEARSWPSRRSNWPVIEEGRRSQPLASYAASRGRSPALLRSASGGDRCFPVVPRPLA